MDYVADQPAAARLPLFAIARKSEILTLALNCAEHHDTLRYFAGEGDLGPPSTYRSESGDGNLRLR